MSKSTRAGRGTLERVVRRNRLIQQDVAGELGVAPETFSRWVRGHAVPDGPNLIRLLAFLRQYEPDLQAEELLR